MRQPKEKYHIILIALILSILYFFPGQNFLYPESPVKWYDFNSGFLEAKRTKKNILIDMYAPWCGWCKVMDKETFNNKKVAELLKNNFIAVRVDMDSRERINYKGYNLRPAEFSNLFGVQGLPTVVFLDDKGEFVDKVPGFVKADLFSIILQYITDGCYKKQILFKDYAEGREKCR